MTVHLADGYWSTFVSVKFGSVQEKFNISLPLIIEKKRPKKKESFP